MSDKVRIEAYISYDNYSKIRTIRDKLNEKGFSKVMDSIINKYFENMMTENSAVERLTKMIVAQESKIKNLQYEKGVKHDRDIISDHNSDIHRGNNDNDNIKTDAQPKDSKTTDEPRI